MTSSDEDMPCVKAVTPADLKRFHAKSYTNPTFLLKMHSDVMANWDEIRKNAIAAADAELEEMLLGSSSKSSSKGGGNGNGNPPRSSKAQRIKIIQSNRVSLATVTRNIDKVQWGKFLLCRVIAPPFILGSLQTVLDDPEGVLGVRLMVSQFGAKKYPNGATIDEGNEALPVGTILAVKNPIFQSSNDNRVFRLMVTNWEDNVVIMDQKQIEASHLNVGWIGEIREDYKKWIKGDLPPPPPPAPLATATGTTKKERKGSISRKCNAKPHSTTGSGCACCPIPSMDWKRIGNEYFVAKDYNKAILAYGTGLDLDPKNVDLLANRAAAYLNTDQFQLALFDCEELLKRQPNHNKGIFRRVRALWGLERYEDAKKFLEVVIKHHNPPKEILDLNTKTAVFIQQSKQGVYNMKEVITKCASKDKDAHVEWAEYKLRGGTEVRETKDGRGRGLFAASTIARGKLILVSKALVHIPSKKAENIEPGRIFADLDLDKTRAAVVEKICSVINENPDRGRAFYKLYAGSELGHLDFLQASNTGLDARRIAGVVRHNMFGFGSNIPIGDHNSSVGIWPGPSGSEFSCINHACIGSNAHWMVHGDMMIVRAARDIARDEEITISYLMPTRDFVVRRQVSEWFGFTCKCEVCEYDRNEADGIREKRRKYLGKLKNMIAETESGIGYNSLTAPLAQDWIEWLQILRPKYNLYLNGVLSLLINHFEDIADYEQGVQLRLLQCEWAMGVAQMAEPVFRNMLGIVDIFLRLEQTSKVRKCLDLLKEATLTAYGTLDVLDLKYKAAIEYNYN